MDLRTRNIARTGLGWLLSAILVVTFLVMVASWSTGGRLDTESVSAQECPDDGIMAEDGSCVPPEFYASGATDYCPVLARLDAEGRAEWEASVDPDERAACVRENTATQSQAHARAVAQEQAVRSAQRAAEIEARRLERGCY